MHYIRLKPAESGLSEKQQQKDVIQATVDRWEKPRKTSRAVLLSLWTLRLCFRQGGGRGAGGRGEVSIVAHRTETPAQKRQRNIFPTYPMLARTRS